MKPLILGYSPWAASDKCHPFDAIFHEQVSLLECDVAECDAIVLWGGTDINPQFYGQQPHAMTWHQEGSTRDQKEWEWLHEAMGYVPIIGVCRGAQMVCAGVGGTLFQHVTGHQGSHPIVTKDGKVYQSSSAHHQMLNLSALPEDSYDVLAWSDKNRSRSYEDDSGKLDVGEGFKEPEIVLFPNVRALAIQGHPEWHETHDPFNQYVLGLVDQLLVKETV